jgi:hypothetical protein
MVYLNNVDYLCYLAPWFYEFWVIKTINIYEFLHILSLIKIRPNMDFGRNLAFAHTCHNTLLFFPKK